MVLGPYMADRIAAKRVLRDRMVSIPVWSRRDEVYPLPREGHALRASLGLDGKFVAMYSGNLGLAHCFDEILEAARRLRDRDDFVFLFVGEGPRPGGGPRSRSGAKGWTTSACSTTSPASNCTSRCRWPTST